LAFSESRVAFFFIFLAFPHHPSLCRVSVLAHGLLITVLYMMHDVTKQYNLVPAKAGEWTDTPRDTLTPYSWPRSVSWCLAEGYETEISAA